MQETLIVPLSVFLMNFLRLINAVQGEFFKIRLALHRTRFVDSVAQARSGVCMLTFYPKSATTFIKHNIWGILDDERLTLLKFNIVIQY